MTNDPSSNPADLANAYVDGELSESARRAFEAALAEDAGLREQVEALRRVDAAVRMIGASGEAAPDPRAWLPTAAPAGRMTFRRRALLAMAAVLGLALLGRLGMEGVSAWTQRTDVAAVYRAVTADFVPQHVCATPEEFVAYTTRALGAGITADFTSGVALVGWSSPVPGAYGEAAGPLRRMLLAEGAGGTRVVVLFEDPRLFGPRLDGASGLNVFSRRLGPVTAFEVTPGPEPVVLGLLAVE